MAYLIRLASGEYRRAGVSAQPAFQPLPRKLEQKAGG
jgi:hypothetical protein